MLAAPGAGAAPQAIAGCGRRPRPGAAPAPVSSESRPGPGGQATQEEPRQCWLPLLIVMGLCLPRGGALL